MSHIEEEFIDVMVVLNEYKDADLDNIVASLTTAGLKISDVDKENGVVEGTIPAAKRKELSKIEAVKYVRDVFDFVSEEGDGKDEDGEVDDEPVRR
jgi:hypothetical protein